jgi:hypothetical protein
VPRRPKYFLHPCSAGSASPGSGRPVRQIGYGSVFRLKPFRPHLTAGALSCATTPPDTTTHGYRGSPPDSAQRGITPAFGYGPRLGPVRLDFHQLALCAARRTLLPPPTPFRLASTSRLLTGYRSPRSTRLAQPAGPGRASPVPAATIRTFRAPYAGESFGACASRSSAPSMAFALHCRARHSLVPAHRTGHLTTRQASLHVTDRSVARPQDWGAQRWASTPPVTRRSRQPTTGPPGGYPDRTFTGKRRRAYETKDQPLT